MAEILIPALVVGGLSAFLAMIINIVDALVNNYGEVKININDSKEITVKGGANLMSTLGSSKIFVPSACGGKGSCGLCKVTVKSDIGPILPTEFPYLTKEEQESSVRLSCQIKVKGDLSIEIPEELFNIKEYEVTVESIIDLTHDIKAVKFGLPEEMNFKAGQYVQLIVPPYDTVKESIMRAYSMASATSEKNSIELLIRLVPEGLATTYVHKYMKVGDKLKITGPFGDFYLRDTSSDIIFIAGGSGMAPIKSIALHMMEKDIDRQAYFFFGARTKKDMFYLDLFASIEEQLPNFHFIPALSDPTPEDKWTGEIGLITEVVDRYLKNQGERKREAYLCGSPGMINACVNGVLKTHNIQDNEIFYDKFG